MTTTQDLLRRSAPLALATAAQHCHRHAGADCSWYHGPWPYFRLLGVVSTAAVHEQFLGATLAELLRNRVQPRILISGTTDYALLALLLDALAGRPADITVADLCPTPLALCDGYARERGIAISTRAGDILTLTTEHPFDLVCTHAFMGYFDDAARAALVRQWHALLKPGGQLLTVQRIRPDAAPGLVQFSPDQSRAFRDLVLAEATRRRHELDLEPEQLAAAAQVFAERFRSHPIRSREELARLFTDAGFELNTFAFHDIGQHTPGLVSGPSVPAQAEFAHIIATRR